MNNVLTRGLVVFLISTTTMAVASNYLPKDTFWPLFIPLLILYITGYFCGRFDERDDWKV